MDERREVWTRPHIESTEEVKSVIPNAILCVYSKAEQGDHFLAFKKPIKFTRDLHSFLQSGR